MAEFPVDPMLAKMIIQSEKYGGELLLELHLIWHIQQAGDVIALENLLARSGMQTKEDVAGKEGFFEAHRLAAIFVSGMIAREGDV